MNKLFRLISHVKRLGDVMDSMTTEQSYKTAAFNYNHAVNKLTKLADKISENSWNAMLNNTRYAKSHYRWHSFRSYLAKAVD